MGLKSQYGMQGATPAAWQSQFCGVSERVAFCLHAGDE
jgi:hypothetical protein